MSTEGTPITPRSELSVSPPAVLAPLSDLRSQINNHHRRALTFANSFIDYALKCGQALVDAKAQLSYGEWTPWLCGNCPNISTRQVQRYMRLADNWPQIQAEREEHPEEILTVSGALALIHDKSVGPNTTSKSHLGPATDESVLDEDSMTDSNATSSRICQQPQQTGPNDADHAVKEDVADESSRSRVSENSEAAAVDTEIKKSAEHLPSVTAMVTNRPFLRTDIVQVCVAELTAHKNYLYVYENSVDQKRIDSIEQHGILKPLIVTFKGKLIVSGLSYWEAAKTLGIETVPVVYLEYQYEYQLLELIVEFNRSRVTTPIQKKREAALLKSASTKRLGWENRNRRKAEDESAEPQE
jgi:hypothetical protein